MPVSVYLINELWNLAPTDRRFNQHIKRDRLPSREMTGIAWPRLGVIYGQYAMSDSLGEALRQDVTARFSRLTQALDASAIAANVLDFLDRTADAGNLARF
jgi:hypothetical protein